MRWRIRLGIGATPLVLFVMHDVAPVVVYLVGFATAVAVRAACAITAISPKVSPARSATTDRSGSSSPAAATWYRCGSSPKNAADKMAANRGVRLAKKPAMAGPACWMPRPQQR